MFDPSPFEGGWRWTASPMQNTRPARYRVAYHLVVAPQRGRADRDRHRVVADQVVDDARRGLVVELGRRLVDVVAPDDQPLVPRAAPSAPAPSRCRRCPSPAAAPSTGRSAGAPPSRSDRRGRRCSSSRRRPSGPRTADRRRGRSGCARRRRRSRTWRRSCTRCPRRGRAPGPSTPSSCWARPRYSVSKRIRDPRCGGVADQNRLQQRLGQIAVLQTGWPGCSRPAGPDGSPTSARGRSRRPAGWCRTPCRPSGAAGSRWP